MENNFNFNKTFSHEKDFDINNGEVNRYDIDSKNDLRITNCAKPERPKTIIKRQNSMNILAKATIVRKEVFKRMPKDLNKELEKNKINI